MDRDEVEVHKLAKKERGQYPTILTENTLINEGFIIWLSGKFFMWDTAGSPERARWLHLARSGSQLQCANWFILPARGASDIINNISDWISNPLGESIVPSQALVLACSRGFRNRSPERSCGPTSIRVARETGALREYPARMLRDAENSLVIVVGDTPLATTVHLLIFPLSTLVIDQKGETDNE